MGFMDGFNLGYKHGIKFSLILCIILLLSITVISISISTKLWVYEKVYNHDDYASRICELFYDAIKDDNLDKVIKISYNIGEWGDDKSKEEREQFENAMKQWADENPYKAERIEDYFRKHRDVIPK